MSVPSRWAKVETVKGLNTVDKEKLIGVPFCILGVTFKSNAGGVQTCYIDAEYADGTEFTFTDASTGVATQIRAHLVEKELDYVISDEGAYAEFQWLALQGLRVSEYDRPLRNPNGSIIPGKTAPAKTYYLAADGVRRGAKSVIANAAPTAPATRTRKTVSE